MEPYEENVRIMVWTEQSTSHFGAETWFAADVMALDLLRLIKAEDAEYIPTEGGHRYKFSNSLLGEGEIYLYPQEDEEE